MQGFGPPRTTPRDQARRTLLVQTHEELIDLAWKASIRPILLKRFPALTEASAPRGTCLCLRRLRHSGLRLLSLRQRVLLRPHPLRPLRRLRLSLLRNTHRRRRTRLRHRCPLHYIGDTVGHSAAINTRRPHRVPPGRKKVRHQPSITPRDPHAHVQTEFAFDINQLSKRRFAPSDYSKCRPQNTKGPPPQGILRNLWPQPPRHNRHKRCSLEDLPFCSSKLPARNRTS